VQERDGKKLPSVGTLPGCLSAKRERELIDHGGCKEHPEQFVPNKKPPSNNHSRRLLAKISAFVRYETPSD
jgi:hypothetical protein